MVEGPQLFSYRHAFHAGNHADVLKHLTLVAVLRHLLEKPVEIVVVDTHAGAGLYDLQGRYAQQSGEADQGLLRLRAAVRGGAELSDAVADYLQVLEQFPAQTYPGSPLIIQKLIREVDRLKAFELHPTDIGLLQTNIAELRAGRQVVVFKEDGFAGVRRFMPPPKRRGFVLCDPSYELKEDYAATVHMLADTLQRFATATVMIWYPVIARRESIQLPKKLAQVCAAAGKPWLNAQMQVKAISGIGQQSSLAASAVFVVNPPYTLTPILNSALPQITEILAQDNEADWSVTGQ